MIEKINYRELIELIPSSKENLGRLQYLEKEANDVRIAVFGKYNHGKSTLLNALIGHDQFKTADKRETTINSEFKKNGIIWIDTPGLDADIRGEDDAKAREGAFKMADFLFLVHNVKTGELDKYEKKLYQDLMRQDRNYKNKMFLILTQIDQLSADDLDQVQNKITNQMPDLTIIPVSAVRYIKGRDENMEKFISLSGIKNLFDLVDYLSDKFEEFRRKEIIRLRNKAKIELYDLLEREESELNTLIWKYENNKSEFELDMSLYMMNVQQKRLEAVLGD